MKRTYIKVSFDTLKSIFINSGLIDEVNVDNIVVNNNSRDIDIYFSSTDDSTVSMPIIQEGMIIPCHRVITTSDLNGETSQSHMSPEELYRGLTNSGELDDEGLPTNPF